MGRAEEIRRASSAAIKESLGRGASSPPTLKITPTSAPPSEAGLERVRNSFSIPLGRIDPDPNQPRREFEQAALTELAESLKMRGQLQPCRVIAVGDRYQMVCGERRLRAAGMAALTHLTCLVIDTAEAAEIEADQIVENAAREDLTPVDLSRAIRHQLDVRGCSQHDLAKRLGISQTMISQALAYDSLPTQVKEAVRVGGLSTSTAVEIAKLPTADEQVAVAAVAVEQGLTRDAVRGIVKDRRKPASSPAAKENAVSESVGAVVPIGRQSPGVDNSVDNPWKAGVPVRMIASRGKGRNGEYGEVARDWEPEDGRIEVTVHFADGDLLAYCDPEEIELVGPAIAGRPVTTGPTNAGLAKKKEEPVRGPSWGCDLPGGGTVAVMLPIGGRILPALYDAIEIYKAEQEAAKAKEKTKRPKA